MVNFKTDSTRVVFEHLQTLLGLIRDWFVTSKSVFNTIGTIHG